MLTHEKLVEILREGKQCCGCNLFTDTAGLAFIAGCSERTVRLWRCLREGPPAKWTSKWVYDLEDICEWYNASEQKGWHRSATSGTDRKIKEAGGGA